jgi:hypothetical protein
MTILGLPLSLWAIVGMIFGIVGLVGCALFFPEERYRRARREARRQTTADVVKIAGRAERRRREIHQTTNEL